MCHLSFYARTPKQAKRNEMQNTTPRQTKTDKQSLNSALFCSPLTLLPKNFLFCCLEMLLSGHMSYLVISIMLCGFTKQQKQEEKTLSKSFALLPIWFHWKLVLCVLAITSIESTQWTRSCSNIEHIIEIYSKDSVSPASIFNLHVVWVPKHWHMGMRECLQL